MEITLNQTLNLLKKIKENDINDEYDIVVDSVNGYPMFFIQEKIITLKGGIYG